MINRTKTFTQNRWFERQKDGTFVERIEEGPDSEDLDTQIEKWRAATGNTIVHPGQLGMHTQWHGSADEPFRLKCLTFGLVILYQEGSEDADGTE